MHIFTSFLSVLFTFSLSTVACGQKLDSLKSEVKQTGLTISEKANLFLTIGNIYERAMALLLVAGRPRNKSGN